MNKFLLTVVITILISGCGSSSTSDSSQSEPSNEIASSQSAPEFSVGQKLASIDGVYGEWPEYERRIAQGAERCGQDEMKTADQVVLAQRLLDEQGQKSTLLEIIEEAILGSIPASEAGTFECSEVIALYVVLRTN